VHASLQASQPVSAPAPVPAMAAATASAVALDAPVLTHADVAARTAKGWPCHVCGAVVALEHDHCSECGSSFLAGADPTPAVDLPLVGDPRSLTPVGKFGVMIVGGVVVTTLLVLIALVFGSFL